MKHHTILFDTDIGTDVDDALALVVLTRLVNGKSLAVIATNGPAKIRAQAALTLLSSLDQSSIPVFEGISESLSHIAPFTHGKEHIGVNCDLRPKTFTNLLTWINTQPDQSIHLVVTGPATTTALLLSKKHLQQKINRLIIMGGVFQEKNIPSNEHNFSADPKAIQNILKTRVPLFLVPLNVTLQHRLDSNVLRKNRSPAGRLLWRWTTLWLKTTRSFRDEDKVFKNSVFLHDPITIIAALRPEKFHWKSIRITVNDQGKILTGGNRNIFVCTKLTNDVLVRIKEAIMV